MVFFKEYMLVFYEFFFKFFDVNTIILDYQVVGYENLWMSCFELHLVWLSIITWSFKCVMLSLWNNTSSSSLAMYNSLFYKVAQTLLLEFFLPCPTNGKPSKKYYISVPIQDDGSFDEALARFLPFTYTQTNPFCLS